MQIHSKVFCAKLLTHKQTNRQTSNDENISSLVEVMTPWRRHQATSANVAGMQRTSTPLATVCGCRRGGCGGRTARGGRASNDSSLVVVDVSVCGRCDRGVTPPTSDTVCCSGGRCWDDGSRSRRCRKYCRHCVDSYGRVDPVLIFRCTLCVLTFRVRCSRGEMYVGHAHPRVCVSVPCRIPTLLHGPRCNFGEW